MPNFQIMSLDSTNMNIVDVDRFTGDDRGGIAVSTDRVFLTGDFATAALTTNLASPLSLAGSPRDGIFSDVLTGGLYSLAVASGAQYFRFAGPITQLIQLDSVTGQPTGASVALSTAIPESGFSFGNGVFAGAGRVVIFHADASKLYDIDTATGLVTTMNVPPLPLFITSESWASWGVAEFFNGGLHLVYSTGTSIIRYSVLDGTVTELISFGGGSDVANIAFSATLGRWYFHYESEFTTLFPGSFPEALGYANATYQTKPDIVGTSGSDALTGTPDADGILGLEGNDTISGLAGSDFISGGAGDDSISGDNGNDVLGGGDGADTIDGGLDNDNIAGLAGADSLSGGAGADTLLGGLDADRIDGGADADNIDGGDAGDTLNGGSGSDSIIGGAGDDSVQGDDGSDTIRGSEGNDTLNGGAGDDLLTGDAGNDIFEDGSGNNTLAGGAGDDTFTVLAATDFPYELLGEGNDTVQTALTFYELTANIENLIFTGVGGFNGRGNEINNVITSGSGADILTGGAGNDTLNAGGGNDYLFIDSKDTGINGGTGFDAAFVQDNVGANLNLGTAGIEWAMGWIGNDTLDASTAGQGVALFGYIGQDSLVGSAFDDFIYFDSFDSRVDGGAGYDALIIYGSLGGADIDVAAMNGEWVLGSDGNDRMTNAGRNVSVALSGGSGNDTLVGGLSNDFLYGNAGADVFVVTANAQLDWIADFTQGQDRIDVSGIVGMTNLAAVLAGATATTAGFAQLNFAGGNVVVLGNVGLGALGAGDFIFSLI
ncbi:MAG: calcium-binding protein [Beijerinckiaceae bacterium]